MLNHPNIVQVFGVGIDDGRVWVAMEFVHGQTLKQWLADHPLETADRYDRVLDLVTQAGRGLAAAHAKGLVHRDFKPANVLVGDDGRVRVVDFGLARATAAAKSSGHEESLAATHPESATAGVANTVTRAGGIVGTPKYMSPEQLAGESLDPKSDQYSFCVVAWEALLGAYPFELDDDGQVRRPAGRQELKVAADVSDAPARVRGVLLRGLSARPARRHRSVSAVLQRLVGRGRWPLGLAAAGVLALAAASWGRSDDGPPPAAIVQPCDAEEVRKQAGRLWSTTRADRVRDAFAASGAEGAAVAFDGIDAQLNRFRVAWERGACGRMSNGGARRVAGSLGRAGAGRLSGPPVERRQPTRDRVRGTNPGDRRACPRGHARPGGSLRLRWGRARRRTGPFIGSTGPA